MELLIFDTEYTSWEGSLENNWQKKGEYRELVQLAAIKVSDVNNLHRTELFSVFTKPNINPTLSEYFINLTGITQKKLELDGISIKDGIEMFAKFSENCFCLTWNNDLLILNENIKFLNIESPLRAQKVSDIRELFKELSIDCEGLFSGDIDKKISGNSILKPGFKHNALSDCISMLSALNKLSNSMGDQIIFDLIKKLKPLK